MALGRMAETFEKSFFMWRKDRIYFFVYADDGDTSADFDQMAKEEKNHVQERSGQEARTPGNVIPKC